MLTLLFAGFAYMFSQLFGSVFGSLLIVSLHSYPNACVDLAHV